jgi:Transposase, Mutator family
VRSRGLRIHISRLNVKLDEELERFASRRLEEPYPYLILDARYEKVRDNGVITSEAVMMRSEWIGKAGGTCWRWSWPIANRLPAGKSSAWH